MQFKYVPPRDVGAPHEHEAWGLTWVIGEPVEVEDPAVIEKLLGNRHYAVVEAAPDSALAALRNDAAQFGVEVDMRWGAKRLQAEIDKALAG